MSRIVLSPSTPRLVVALVGALALMVATLAAAEAAPARTTADLNLRSGPGTHYHIVASMPRGSLVDILGCTRGWCEVAWRGRVGWASSRFLVEGGRPLRPGRPFPEPHPQPGYPFPFPFPFPVPIPDPGYDHPDAGLCVAGPARFVLGRRASQRNIDAAFDASGARRLRVIEPGEMYTQDYREDRLNVQVDFRGIIVSVDCR